MASAESHLGAYELRAYKQSDLLGDWFQAAADLQAEAALLAPEEDTTLDVI